MIVTSTKTAWCCAARIQTLTENLDGINFDIEHNSGNKDALTALVKETRAGLTKAGDGRLYQVSFATNIFPKNHANGYDMAAMAEYLDFFVPMGYDMCWGTKSAKPNDPIKSLAAGVAQYTADLKISPSQVVLGLPWYSWSFPCDSGNPGDACTVTPPKGNPWYGYAKQITFTRVISDLENSRNVSSVVFDSDTATKHYDVIEAGKRHQVWFDDPETLTPKYQMAKAAGLRGVAFWHAGCVNYTAADGQARAMWDALKHFF